MDRPSVITFVSDFGRRGGYVAACEATVLSLAPNARMLHVGHEVPLGDVRDAARCLARVAPLGPVAVHLAVVDPGVGTRRRPLAVLAARGDLLVGPDNGLLAPAAAALGGVTAAWELDPARVRTAARLPVETLSHTFHGRDVFAPAAALLAAGRPPASMAEPIDPDSLILLPDPLVDLGVGSARVEVMEVDRFGNVALCVSLDDLPREPRRLSACVEGEPDARWVARRVRTFGDLGRGELGLLQDSWGHASLALNGASAAELLGARVGCIVELRGADALSGATGPARTPAHPAVDDA